jgi:uncharacterized protein (DUF2062 family)
MEPQTRALLVDFILAALALALGAVSGGVVSSAWAVLIAAVGLLVFVPSLYVAEHCAFLTLVEATRPVSFGVISLAMTVITVALIGGFVVVPSPAGSLLLGFGLGLFVYRTLYGVVRPLPDRRRRQTDDGSGGVASEPPP